MQPTTAMFEERILKTKSTHAPSVESAFRMHTNSNCIWIFIPCRRTSSAYIFRLWWSCNIANLVCFILKMFCLFAQYLKCFYIFVWYSFKIKYNLTAILCSWYILYSCRLMWMSWKIYIYITGAQIDFWVFQFILCFWILLLQFINRKESTKVWNNFTMELKIGFK